MKFLWKVKHFVLCSLLIWIMVMYQASVGQLYELVCSARGVSKEKVSALNLCSLLSSL